MRSYRDLEVWQKSMTLAQEVYAAAGNFPKSEVFGLTAQMRRAAVSVPSNIAEGQGRSSDGAFAVFLNQARGSLFELETQAQLAEYLGCFQSDTHQGLCTRCSEVGRLLHGLLRALSKEQE